MRHIRDLTHSYRRALYISAMAWLLFAIVLILTIIQLRTSRRWVHYESD